MASTSQHLQLEEVGRIMLEMKRSARDLLGEAPLTPLTSSPHQKTPCKSFYQSSPWVTPPFSTFMSTSYSDDTRVLRITRSYRSPFELLNDDMVSDHLPPSPHAPAFNRSRDIKKHRQRRQSTKHRANEDAMSDSEASAQYSADSDVITSSSRAPPSKKRRRTDHPSSSNHSGSVLTGITHKKHRSSSENKAMRPGANKDNERTVSRVAPRVLSKHLKNLRKASASIDSQSEKEGSSERRSERRRSSSKYGKIPGEERSRGTKRRAERGGCNATDRIDKEDGDEKRLAKRTRDERHYVTVRNLPRTRIAPRDFYSELPNKRRKEAGGKVGSIFHSKLSKTGQSTDRHRRVQSSCLFKDSGRREGGVEMHLKRSGAPRATAQHPPLRVDQSPPKTGKGLHIGSGFDHGRECERGRGRSDKRSRAGDRPRDRDYNRKLGSKHTEVDEVGFKNSGRGERDANQILQVLAHGGHEPAREKPPFGHINNRAFNEQRGQKSDIDRDHDVEPRGNMKSGKTEITRGRTVQGRGGGKQDLDKKGATNNAETPAQRKGHFLGLRSYPVRFTQFGQGIVLNSKVTQPIANMKPTDARGLDATVSSAMSRGAASGQCAGPSSSREQSQHAGLHRVKEKGLELYGLYKKAKERCQKLLEKKEYSLYEVVAKDCVRFYFEWALSLEADLHLSEAEVRQGNSIENGNRRRHVTQAYQYMTNHLIPSRIRELKGINRHQSTHYFSRILQIANVRLFYFQRVWNRVAKSGFDVFCQAVSAACIGKQVGDKVVLTLEYEQMTEFRDILLQYQNNINIAEQIVSDSGDGHDEAENKSAMC